MKKLFTLAFAAALVCFMVLPVGAAAKPVSELCEYSGSPDSFWVTENYDGQPQKQGQRPRPACRKRLIYEMPAAFPLSAV